MYPLAWLVTQEVSGEDVRVVDMTPAGTEPHDLELRPSDLRLLHDADAVVYIGRRFQPSLEHAIRSSSARLIDVLDAPGLNVDSGDQLADPHVWLDPVRMRAIADYVASRLPGADNRAVDASLARLDADYRQSLAQCDSRTFVTTHDAFGYLAARYRLTQRAIAGVAPEAEPRPRDLERVIDGARRAHAATIFFEPLVSPRIADTVAREVGAQTAVLDPIEGISPRRLQRGDDYITLMHDNLAALTKALHCD